MSAHNGKPDPEAERAQVKAVFAAQQAARAEEEARKAREAAEAAQAAEKAREAAAEAAAEAARQADARAAEKAAEEARRAEARAAATAATAAAAAARAAEPPAAEKLRFPGMSPRAYEHPADAAAMAALRKLPGFDTFLRRFMGAIGERRLRYLYLASAVRVNENQFTDLYRAYRECCEILDIQKIPELYVSQSPIVNAGAIGLDEPFIVLNSATLELYPTDEIPFVLGHELGHILSDHVLYKTMLRILLQLGLGRMGLPGLAILGIIAALKEWDRKSELSSDRAGLLCVQDADTAYRILMKMAGGPQTHQMNAAEFEKQAEEYERGGDLRDSALKLLNLLWLSHPFPVLRLAELKRFVERGDYAQILRGDYVRNTDLDGRRIIDEWSAGANAYKQRMAESEDPLMNFLRDFGSSVGEAGSSVWDSVRGAFKKKPEGGDKTAPPADKAGKTEPPAAKPDEAEPTDKPADPPPNDDDDRRRT
jgi:Zn-dependent protease with chaperone function